MTTKSKKPKTVALAGFARSTRDLAPWEDKSIEIWGMNEGYSDPFMKRYDRWFQLHPRWNFARPDNPNDVRHFDWLREEREYPIYMQELFPDIPGCIRFPIEEIIELIGVPYITSTVAMMLLFAYLEGFERIELYGIEMVSETEYGYQKPGGEFVLGWLKGKGIDIWMPPSCSLLKAPVYGYQEVMTGYRQYLEHRMIQLVEQEKEHLHKGLRSEGALAQIREVVKNLPPRTPKSLREHLQERIVALVEETEAHERMLNVIGGAKQECHKSTGKYDEASWGERMYGEEITSESTDETSGSS